MAMQFDCRYQYRGGFTLDARFEAGDGITAVFGPSGSGKTTILMLLAGLLKPQRGRIVLHGRVLVDTSQHLWAPPHRRAIGLVFQDSLLFPHRSVRENLMFGHKRRPTDDRFSLDHVVDVLELRELLARYPATLSGGEARRVAIGRAVLSGPRLLLLDEPCTGLDEPLRDRVTALIERCAAEWSIPMLLVSHDRRSVQSLARRVVEIEAGGVRDSGRAPEALI